MRHLLSVLGFCLATQVAWGKVEKGQIPPQVVIAGEDGGKIAGGAWDSASLKGKVHFVAYVDPDEKDINGILEQALDKEKFPQDKYQSTGIINMEATWLPNFAIASAIKDKQEKFPQVVYVKDLKKVLVNKWGIADDAYVVLVFDKEGKLIWESVGALDTKQSADLVATIKSHLDT